jgi:dipeptidyl-peptidase-4
MLAALATLAALPRRPAATRLVAMTHNPLAAVAAALVLSAPAVGGPPIDTSFLKRYAETRGFMLGRPQKPKFTPDGKTVLFLRADPPAAKLKLFAFDVATGQTKELLTPEMLLKGGDEQLTPEEKARRERQRVSTGGFADYHLDESGNRVLVMLSGRPWVFDRTTGKARELNAGKGTIVDPKWSPDGKWVSYVRDYDVMTYDLANDKEVSVTTGGTAEKTHGLAEFVAQEEMGRHTGYWWSPDSSKIAYAEADHAGVELWHVADPFKPGVPPQAQYYPRPGKKNVSVRLGVKPVSGGETVWVEWDRSKYEYLARVCWVRAGLLLAVQSRNQKGYGVLRAEPETGRTSLFGGETWDAVAWQEVPELKPLDGIGSAAVMTDIGTSRKFLLHYSPAGRPVTTRATADEVLAVNGNTQWFYLSGSDDPTTRYVSRSRYVLTPRGETPGDFLEGEEVLTNGPGIHTAAFSPDCSTAVFTATSLGRMPAYEVRAAAPNGGKLGTLPSVAAEPPFTPNVKVEKVGDYWTAVVRPRDFDPKKKYPVIVDVYGGPHHLHVLQAMRNWLIPQWLADQGFVVVALDNRGTPGRGAEWEKAIYGKFGTVPLDDQVKGLTALCDKFPELDRDRVGIVGWSFGGYMAANAVLRRPDVFKAAVAGAPVTAWEDYDTHYTERYLGLLPESRAAYDEASLLPLAKNLSRPLLLVHGTADDNVYYRHSLKLADALFRAGREFESLPLPGVTHMYSADPQVAERLWERAVTFFKRHLGEPK